MDSFRSDPDQGRNEFDGGEEIERAFVVAGGDAAVLFDPVEEALDEVALPIHPSAKGYRGLPVSFGGILAQMERALASARIASLS